MQDKSSKVSGSRLLPQSSKAIPKVMHEASKTNTKCNFNAVSDCREPVLFAICFFMNARNFYPPYSFCSPHFLNTLSFCLRDSHTIVEEEHLCFAWCRRQQGLENVIFGRVLWKQVHIHGTHQVLLFWLQQSTVAPCPSAMQFTKTRKRPTK